MVTIGCVGGIGDVLFCEPIFKHYYLINGLKPTVVIHNHMMWLQAYIDSAFFTNVCPKEFETGSKYHSETMINLRYANQIFRSLDPHDHHDFENCMLDKYRLLGLNEELWKTININFNFDKGAELAKHLNVGLFNEYYLRNEYCGAGKIDIELTKNKLVVDVLPIGGYNVLDWYLLHTQADGIHTVSTSTFYMMQALMNKNWMPPDIYIYARPNEDGVRGISQLKPDFNYFLK